MKYPEGSIDAIRATIKDQTLRQELKRRGSSGPAAGMTGGSAFTYPESLLAERREYWGRKDLIDKGPILVGGGGKLMRVADDRAVYEREGVEPFVIWPDSDFNLVANIDPAIGAEWESKHPGYTVVQL